MFGNMLGDLVNCRSYQVLGDLESEGGMHAVRVNVVGPAGQTGEYEFTMVQKELGRKAGSWMTKSVLKAKA